MYFWLKEIGIDGIPRIGEHKSDRRAKLCLSYTAGTTALSAIEHQPCIRPYAVSHASCLSLALKTTL